MGWSASQTAQSEVGTSITFTPSSSVREGEYTVSSFTAPQKGIYQFVLKGSGGSKGNAANKISGVVRAASGGAGGSTTGYLLLERNQTVYVGAGGTCSAAFVSSATGDALSAVPKNTLYFVAGGGGGGGAYADNLQRSGQNCTNYKGGIGGGSAGGNSENGGAGGTASAGGEAGGSTWNTKGKAGTYGKGGDSVTSYSYLSNGHYGSQSGRGGDGYYGGGSGHAYTYGTTADSIGGARSFGGGGGSGYIKTKKVTWAGETYSSSTSQGSGAAPDSTGSIAITIIRKYEVTTFELDKKSVGPGQRISFTLSNEELAELRHTVLITFGGDSKETINLDVGVSNGSYLIPVNWVMEIPDRTSASASIIVTTYKDDLQIGSTSDTFTFNVPEGITPTEGSLLIARIDNSVPADWGIFVQNISGISQTAMGFSGAYGSTIKEYIYRIGKKYYTSTSTSLTIEKIGYYGTVTVGVTAVDSRGREVSRTTTIDVAKYTEPAFSQAQVGRVDSTGQPEDMGTYALFEGGFTYSSCNNKNAVNASVYYKKSTDTTYSYVGAYTGGQLLFGNGTIDTDYDYDVLFRVQDQFRTIEKVIRLDSVTFTMHFKKGGESVGFGRPAQRNKAVEVSSDWDLYVGDVNVLDRIENVQRAIFFSVPTSAWTGSSSYTSLISDPTITANSMMVLLTFDGNSHVYCSAPITWTTRSGEIVLTTTKKPSGELSGCMFFAEL